MKIKLLIVEDSELIRNCLVGLLEDIHGIEEIHTADTLAQALDCARRVLPTLVILDLHLPDGNAMKSIKALKQGASGTQIAVFTNDANDFNRRKCLEAGSDWFFDKSMEFSDLLDVVVKQAALA